MSSYNLSRYFMTAPQGQRKTLQKKVCLGYDGAVRKWRMITFVIGLLKSSNVCSAQWSKVKTNIILHFWKLNFLKRVEIVGKNRPKGIVESKINQKKVTGKVKKGPKRTFKSVKILSNMITKRSNRCKDYISKLQSCSKDGKKCPRGSKTEAKTEG